MSDELPRWTRVAAYALCVEGDAILLSRIAPGATSDSDGMWTLPGGGIEFGEDPRDAALRELREETGLTGDIVELAAVNSWTSRFLNPADGEMTDFHGIQIVYRVQVTGGELTVETDGSSDLCAWVPRRDLPGLSLVELADLGVRLAFHAT